MKIAVVGTGYVGLSLAILLSQKNEVVALDIIPEKINKINKKISPIQDEYIEKYFAEKKLNLKATLDYKEAFEGAKYVIISTPTNYDDKTNFFDTSLVEDIIKKVISMKDPNMVMVVKSTIPVGFINKMKEKYGIDNILFSPEFLREGKALYDNLYPSRIVVSYPKEQKNLESKAKEFANILKDCALKKDVEILIANTAEAESIKLFANTYLALRVSYFNELDTFAEYYNLDSNQIIKGVSLDPRIGDYYNNPSFGYGGYCLPKDTKQLKSNFKNVPENLISAIVESNLTRKKYIASKVFELIKKRKGKTENTTIGIFRLTMKFHSDNFRQSSIQYVMKYLKEKKTNMIIYEPTLKEGDYFHGYKIINNLQQFKQISDVIVANRYDSCLDDVKEKVYSRDIFKRD